MESSVTLIRKVSSPAAHTTLVSLYNLVMVKENDLRFEFLFKNASRHKKRGTLMISHG